MKQGELFTKTRKEAPKDEAFRSSQFLIRGGFIHKEMAGVYTLLPLGLKVANKIVQIIREQMDAVGGQEIQMTALQDPEIWKKTDRFDDEKVDNWFKTKIKNGTETGLAFTHEEPITRIMTSHIHSYKDLPKYIYQFQTKFRNEMRAKNGIMRGREFLMKDLYSFSLDKETHDDFYQKIKNAYVKIFERVGLGKITFVTFASGGVFSKFSDEFQTESPSGEDIIYLDEEKGIAVNREIYSDEILRDLGMNKGSLVEKKTIEVGNIFTLGTRFSEPLELFYTDANGDKKPVFMGSYGIGIGRVMGVIADVLSDDSGLKWPEAVSPFNYHLINLLPENEDAVKLADKIYSQIKDDEVLYDDRNLRAGEKLADADLIGITKRIIVGKKTLESGEIELVDRITGEIQFKKVEELK